MGILFLQLMNQIDRMETAEAAKEQKLVMDVLSYIEEHYREGELEKPRKYRVDNQKWRWNNREKVLFSN